MVAFSQIGETLKEVRLEKGYTLDDLQQKTKIQRRYLIAIEEGKVEDLPDRYSVSAFIRQYASAVGLDGESLLGTEAFPDAAREPGLQFSAEEQRMTRAELKRTRQKRAAGGEWVKHATLPTYLVVILFLFILAVGWYFLYMK